MTSTGFVRSADGTRIGYERVGSGPVVVALHGGLGTAASWRPVAERLADRCEFWLPDRRGRGHSDPGAEPHNLAREVDDAIAVLDAAGPLAALVGHSFGGAVALETARRLGPKRIRSLAVYEPAVAVGALMSAADIAQLQDLIDRGDPEAALDAGFALLDAAGLVTASPKPARARRPAGLVQLAWTMPRELRAVRALAAEPSIHGSIDVPALVLMGTASPARQQALCRTLAAALPCGHLAELPDFGHVAHTAAPVVVAAALGGWLQAGNNRPGVNK